MEMRRRRSSIEQSKQRLSLTGRMISVDHGACENIYEYMKTKQGTVIKDHFMDALVSRGILPDDPRLSDVISAFENHEEVLQKNVFILIISQSLQVIENAFTNSNNICQFDKFSENLRQMFYACAENTEGELSNYVPQLSRKNPDHFGLSLCTVDGQRLMLGDAEVEFSIQGCTKPISYCLAVEEHGIEVVHKHVGREPSGVRFNALKVNDNGLPHNPLIESGALMISSLVKHHMDASDRFDYVLQQWSDLAGGKHLGFSNSIYLSEKNAGDRNHALVHFMRENNAFPANVDITDVLEFYIQCSALTINTNHLAIVAGSLANGGVCPLTGKQIFSAETVKHCLSMMYSCGMYDYSGEFAFTIGLPAKSGLSGAVIVVIPNVMGICTYSPRLDMYGNSTRGVEFFSRFTDKFNFHMFDCIELTDGTKEDPRQAHDVEDITTEKIIKFSSVGDISALRRIRPSLEDLSQGDYDHRTPLHLAASNGHLNVVRFILDMIGNEHVNPRDRWNGTPYDDAMREKHIDVADYLMGQGGMPGAELSNNIM